MLNTYNNEGSSDDDDIMNKGEKIPIGDVVKCELLIGALEQCAFISEQESVAVVYSIKATILKQKPILMRQMTFKEFLKTVVFRSDTSSTN